MKKTFTLVVAGGKTGGHLFSGIAVAQAMVRIRPDAKILFVGTDSDFERDSLKPYGFRHRYIPAAPIKGRGFIKKISGIGVLLQSFVQSFGILRECKPDVVMGVGGYVSFAPVLAAVMLGVPVTIQEQNAYPGLANRLLAPWVKKVFTGFQEIQHIPERKICYTGTPVRKADTEKIFEVPGLKEDDFLIVITGGSQGASSINNAVIEAMKEFANDPEIFVVHQTGQKQEKSVQEFYEKNGCRAFARSFFPEMPSLFRQAKIVIARSGAGTVAELCMAGAAAILVPYPNATDDHQNANAKQLADKGGVMIIPDKELSGSKLVSAVRQLKSNQATLVNMKKAMGAMAKPCAADRIAEVLLKMDKSRLNVST